MSRQEGKTGVLAFHTNYHTTEWTSVQTHQLEYRITLSVQSASCIKTKCERVISLCGNNSKQAPRKQLPRLSTHLLTPPPARWFGLLCSSLQRKCNGKLFAAGSAARAQRSSSAVVLETELQPLVDMTFYQSSHLGEGLHVAQQQRKREKDLAKEGTRALGTFVGALHSGGHHTTSPISCQLKSAPSRLERARLCLAESEK